MATDNVIRGSSYWKFNKEDVTWLDVKYCMSILPLKQTKLLKQNKQSNSTIEKCKEILWFNDIIKQKGIMLIFRNWV